jgi:hypothetical protein
MCLGGSAGAGVSFPDSQLNGGIDELIKRPPNRFAFSFGSKIITRVGNHVCATPDPKVNITIRSQVSGRLT